MKNRAVTGESVRLKAKAKKNWWS